MKTKQVCELAEIKPRLLTFFIDKGVIVPESGGGKRGADFSFTHKNVCSIRVVGELVKYGITYKKIAEFVKQFENSGALTFSMSPLSSITISDRVLSD